MLFSCKDLCSYGDLKVISRINFMDESQRALNANYANERIVRIKPLKIRAIRRIRGIRV